MMATRTGITATNDPPRTEGRRVPRFAVLMRAAKLIVPQGEFACVIRDVSQCGVSLRGFHRLPAQGPHAIELQEGRPIPVEPVWQRGNEAGFRFYERIAVDTLVCPSGPHPRRQLRLAIPFVVELAFAGRRIAGEVRNISQQGARIRLPESIAIGQKVLLRAPDLPEITANLRWRHGDEAGFVFDDTFSLAEMALFAARLQAPALLG